MIRNLLHVRNPVLKLPSVFVCNYRQIKVKMKFRNSEKVNMLLVYECHKNAIRAKAMYAERYPERNQSSRAIFERMCESLRRTGSFNVTKRNVTKTATSDANRQTTNSE